MRELHTARAQVQRPELDRVLRDRLELVQRERRELATQLTLPCSPGFEATRAALEAELAVLEAEGRGLGDRLRVRREALTLLEAEVEALALERRAHEQRSLSSWLMLLIALAVCGAAALGRLLPLEVGAGACGFGLGWLLAARWRRPAGRAFDVAVVASSVGAVVLLTLSAALWWVTRLEWDSAPLDELKARLLLPSAIVVVGGLTLGVGRRHVPGFLAALAASAVCVVTWVFVSVGVLQHFLALRLPPAVDFAAVCTGFLVPLVFAAFAWGHARPRGRSALIAPAALLGLSLWSSAQHARSHLFVREALPLSALALEAGVAAFLVALTSRGLPRGALLAASLVAVGWAGLALR